MTRSISRPQLKRRIWKKAGGKCAHCGRKLYGMNKTVDHYIPRSKGGTYDQRNLVPLCRDCNQNRGSRIIDPRIYYKYANEWAIEELEEYERWFNGKYKSKG